MRTILLLIVSTSFMTLGWYGHLKFENKPLWLMIFASWEIALFEYFLAVPANRYGISEFTLPQLKIVQEIITLIVFAVLAAVVFQVKLGWNHLAGFACLVAAAFFIFSEIRF